ncbi:tetratricopeptide repeat protein [Paenibacillus sp. HN-1]|uniref:tetratricopeptide repeat protein n=1 Tax=Paenibacillus TaxID=44249 RepID=UPI001CA955F2|nr:MULTISPECIES: tetratricopeptide repeat protein [Paenibacillus]MBY9082237.1 tetratricopeptide repeat protein [Paenibacillus sp. CGMCC 1.18879]MBY9086399.1 tetratricopeptide repeat protein [Paenibacillus sinensis]
MGKIFIFVLLWNLVGNPFLALIILLAILYVLDRRYVGIFPSIAKPFRRARQISRLRTQISLNPNDVTSKFDLARLLAERKNYREARELLQQIEDRYEHSAEYWTDLGYTNIRQDRLEEGEQQMLRGLEINPRVQYGRPLLRLAESFRHTDRDKALRYLRDFQDIQSSSSEAYYLLGTTYRTLGQSAEAKQAFSESIAVYRSLPKYKKRQERGWALRSFFAGLR